METPSQSKQKSMTLYHIISKHMIIGTVQNMPVNPMAHANQQTAINKKHITYHTYVPFKFYLRYHQNSMVDDGVLLRV